MRGASGGPSHLFELGVLVFRERFRRHQVVEAHEARRRHATAHSRGRRRRSGRLEPREQRAGGGGGGGDGVCACRRRLHKARRPSDDHAASAEVHPIEELQGHRCEVLVTELEEGELAAGVQADVCDRLDGGGGAVIPRQREERRGEEVPEHLGGDNAHSEVADVELACLA